MLINFIKKGSKFNGPGLSTGGEDFFSIKNTGRRLFFEKIGGGDFFLEKNRGVGGFRSNEICRSNPE